VSEASNLEISGKSLKPAMPVTFAEDAADATGEEAKAADDTRVTPDEKDASARCETVKKVATELTKPPEKYQATAATELCGLPDRCCAPEKCCGGRTPILSAEKRERRSSQINTPRGQAPTIDVGFGYW